ncbi:MAG: CoA transferase [Alphaproteobacteria bacterium]
MSDQGQSPAGPFSGVTVVDLTRVLAGPYCTMVLADLGARVVKVETPDTGDDARHIGPFVNGKSAYFMSLNRGKESIALDLRDDKDKGVFKRLLERADVLVENFRPGTMERLGLGFETLASEFPRLIYAAASGFGHTGPAASRPAYDMVVQAMGGIMSLTGHPGGPPTRVGTSIGDITAGLFTAVGIASALYHRSLGGMGMKIDVAMFDCQIAILENAIARYLATGAVPGPLGARHPTITPFDAFKTRDRYIVIAAGNDRLFGRLCETLGRADLGDNPLFVSNESRTRHAAALKDEIEAALAARAGAEWLAALEAAGIPCGPINTVADALADPQTAARNMIIAVDDPVAGRLQMAGNPIKLSAFPDPPERKPAPDLGQHQDRIASELEDKSAARGKS